MPYDPREFIASVSWRFAKTMPENPHWYVGGPLSDGFLDYLAAAGEVRNYKGYPSRYVTVDDHDSSTTQSDDAGAIINRKPSAVAGWDPG